MAVITVDHVLTRRSVAVIGGGVGGLSAAHELAELLRAAAAYAAGGMKALAALRGRSTGATRLIEQMR